MSSSIQVQRICQHCGTEFTARTTVTRYCSDACSKRAYKARGRSLKVTQSNEETELIRHRPIRDLKSKEFLSVTEVSKLIGCCRRNVYKMIQAGKLPASNYLERKTTIKRSDIDAMFEKNKVEARPAIPDHQKEELNEWREAGYLDIAECYTISEIQKRFNLSESTTHNLIKRHNLPKIKKGWYSYVPKHLVDELLKNDSNGY